MINIFKNKNLMNFDKKFLIFLAGLIATIGVFLTGVGEFLIHYSFDLNNPNNIKSYSFFLNISPTRIVIGNFFAVLFSPFYLVGYWHLYKMLEPSSQKLRAIIFFVGCYSFIIGAVWLGSRANLGLFVINEYWSPNFDYLINKYKENTETLIQILRIAMVIISILFVYLVLFKKTRYPKWIALLNPALLLALIFVIYLILPSLGIILGSAAMNLIHFILFLTSTIICFRQLKNR